MSKPFVRNRLRRDGVKRGESFSAMDVIRITCLNLQKDEIRIVYLFFSLMVPMVIAADAAGLADLLGKRVPRSLTFFLKRFLRTLILLGLAKMLDIIGLRPSTHDLDVLDACLTRLQKFFGIIQ